MLSKPERQHTEQFQRDRAFELLKLVEEAHKRYGDLVPKKSFNTRRSRSKRMFDHVTPASKSWGNGGWESDYTQPIHIDHYIEGVPHPQYQRITSSPYQVLAHLIFTQTVWSFTDLRNGFKRKNLFGFIAKKTGTSDLYVVFRGTSNPGEWISNVKLIQQSYTSVSSHDTDGQTHWGFRRTYDRPETYGKSKEEQQDILWATRWFDNLLLKNARPMRDVIEKTLIEECSTNTPNATIYVTGHSLGGALATLAAAHIRKLANTQKLNVQPPILYSFASPRVGDVEFAQSFKNTCSYRISNSEDLVPKIPLPTLLPVAGRLPARNGILAALAGLIDQGLDYQHIGEPIYFTLQERSISDNHTLPVYFKGLGNLPKFE